jgi:hypothetical protein
MVPPGRSAAVEGYRAEVEVPIDSIIIPAICVYDVPIDLYVTYTFPTAFWRDWGHGELFFPPCPRTSSVSVSTPPDPSSSAHVNQPGQDTHGMTPSTTKSRTNVRPLEKKVSASARDLRLGLTMTPTTPTTRPATRSRTQNISAEHELRIIVIFLLRADGVRGVVRLLRVLVLRYVPTFPSFVHADLIT